ncbi:hypothetical protein [Plastoroseomonas arctica]|uniref:Uncharacterized protein n=1 Tax=Plastoroseomonas arctica TaxID=1509237 RepID=A0AAF1KNK0_9PROT|nr:hypothetical protein [Plastoroseomonas arctica]MBR0654703.1 hypothetical protein [Plastoroseomonas arctica]
MNAAYLSALSALLGSAIGALASLATTWLTQRHQDRAQRRAQEATRQERLYGEFIDEAAKLYVDAMTHAMEDPTKIVHLTAVFSKIRLFAPPSVIEAAEAVIRRIIETYYDPNEDFAQRPDFKSRKNDFLTDFTTACRNDLRA